MDTIAIIAAVVLILTFTAAAVAKLRNLSGVATGFADLGLPSPQVLSKVVPAGEILAALLLVFATPIGATVAFAVLLGFTVFLVQLMRDGAPVPCNCFGATSDRPVGVIHLIRNGLLIGCAILALFSPNLV